MTFPSKGGLEVERREIGEGIEAFAVDGTPGDCVALALTGLMTDPPDLVISGINGGANVGAEWLFSGTIGAARVASLGVPAVAVSGLDDDLPVRSTRRSTGSCAWRITTSSRASSRVSI